MAIWIQSGRERGGGGERPRDLGRFRLATHRLLTCNLELNVGEATHGHRGESTRSCYPTREFCHNEFNKMYAKQSLA